MSGKVYFHIPPDRDCTSHGGLLTLSQNLHEILNKFLRNDSGPPDILGTLYGHVIRAELIAFIGHHSTVEHILIDCPLAEARYSGAEDLPQLFPEVKGLDITIGIVVITGKF